MDPVEQAYGQFSDMSELLRENGEISLEVSLDDAHRKVLLLAAASYFEFRLTADVQSYCDQVTGLGSPVSNLVKTKAISRQYHTWFNWEAKNANQFFSLFGANFKDWMAEKIKKDAELDVQIRDFLGIGLDRNRLVHQNFVGFSLEASPVEIFERYKSARSFVNRFGELLIEYSKSLKYLAENPIDA